MYAISTLSSTKSLLPLLIAFNALCMSPLCDCVVFQTPIDVHNLLSYVTCYCRTFVRLSSWLVYSL